MGVRHPMTPIPMTSVWVVERGAGDDDTETLFVASTPQAAAQRLTASFANALRGQAWRLERHDNLVRWPVVYRLIGTVPASRRYGVYGGEICYEITEYPLVTGA